MPGSSTSSSTWMLPLLLLPLFSSYHHLSLSLCVKPSREFNINVRHLGNFVKHCPENCSSVNITDARCRCLNLSVSQGECAFPQYFITGLKSLVPNILIPRNITVKAKHLIQRLEKVTSGTCQEIKFCSVNNGTKISPKTFLKKLEDVMQQHNTVSTMG